MYELGIEATFWGKQDEKASASVADTSDVDELIEAMVWM